MSEHITHLAVAEDSGRLAISDPRLSAHFRYAIENFPLAVRLGSTTRSGDAFIFPLLSEWRQDWQPEDPRSEQLAYIIGWAGHLAGDRTFKPTFRITDLAHYVAGYPGPANASVYQDAATYQHVYDSGQREPFHPATLTHELSSHPAAAHFPVRETEPIMGYSLAGQLAELRAFSRLGTENWAENYETFEDERQKFYVEVARYTEATESPDPGRLHQYLLEPNFYDPADPLLAYAKALRDGDVPEQSLEAVIAEPGESLYAQSLHLGHSFYMACSDYFEGLIDEDTGRERMRTNQPHKQSLDYYVEQANAQENE